MKSVFRLLSNAAVLHQESYREKSIAEGVERTISFHVYALRKKTLWEMQEITTWSRRKVERKEEKWHMTK